MKVSDKIANEILILNSIK